MVQLNTPYPATPVLAGFLKEQGVDAVQFDMSLAVALRMFTPEWVEKAAAAASAMERPSEHLVAFLDNFEDYVRGIRCAVPFLQGARPEIAWRLAQPGFLPPNTNFRELDPSGQGLEEENLHAYFGAMGVQDRAKFLASLFIDDVADVFREALDPEFGLAKYAEHLAAAAPSFGPMHARLSSGTLTPVDRLVDEFVAGLVGQHRPDIVGVTAPFPGTVYGAFRVAECVRRHAPGTRLVLGGGYVNSELRDMDDPRVFDYFDFVCYDEGFAPWLAIIGKAEMQSVRTRDGFSPAKRNRGAAKCKVRVSDYDGLDLDAYLSVVETANPMHRLWTDGRWLKVQLAQGCYWHRCAFCDVALDYIGRYCSPDPKQAVDALVQMRDATGIGAFHFTDEAIPPALLRGICREIKKRGEVFTWWGNIRFDEGFDSDLAELMAETGCIGVSAGLECANDRLLALMDKGITLERTRRICSALADSGIMVHVYLMYAFPTQTPEEVLGALEFTRDLFADGLIQSAYWHRFALTVHSPIAANPARFGIELLPLTLDGPRFALNEIPYRDSNSSADVELPPPNIEEPRFALNETPRRNSHSSACDAMGEGLRIATYNYMRGAGLELPVESWFRS